MNGRHGYVLYNKFPKTYFEKNYITKFESNRIEWMKTQSKTLIFLSSLRQGYAGMSEVFSGSNAAAWVHALKVTIYLSAVQLESRDHPAVFCFPTNCCCYWYCNVNLRWSYNLILDVFLLTIFRLAQFFVQIELVCH